MKKEKQNISVRELFRKNLGDAEIMPDPMLSAKLMKRVARREFFRFNPARINIFYVGGLVAAGIATAIVLLTGEPDTDKSSVSVPVTGSVSEAVLEIKIRDTESVLKQPDINMAMQAEVSNNEVIAPSVNEVYANVTESAETKPARMPAIQKIGNTPFRNKNVTSGNSSEMNMLHVSHIYDGTLIEQSAMQGCIPLKVRFQIKSDTYDSCSWTFGDGGYSSEKNPEWIFDDEGEYKVILELYTKDGSKRTCYSSVTVYPKPVARFEILSEEAVVPDKEINFVNYSLNAVQYFWDFGDGARSQLFEPGHTYSRSGNYNIRLLVTSEYGCSDSLIVTNIFSDLKDRIVFPNAFIPNSQGPSGGYYSSKSDEAAQVFHPGYVDVSSYNLRIYSKVGILIFESNDIHIGWDGYYKGVLCDPGVYIWKVRGNFRNGESFIRMGDVTLLKE